MINTASLEAKNTKTPVFVLFTGLSGAGKSTMAQSVYERLIKAQINTYVLDGDHLRKGINKDLKFTEPDRKENLRRMAEIAKLFMSTGTVVLAAYIAPYKDSRALIKSIVGSKHYIEVFINTSLETCKRRDPKGLYAKVARKQITNFTGIDAPYERPENPTIQITENETVEEAVDVIYKLIAAKVAFT